jgi:DNA-binding NtrC family response regulator
MTGVAMKLLLKSRGMHHALGLSIKCKVAGESGSLFFSLQCATGWAITEGFPASLSAQEQVSMNAAFAYRLVGIDWKKSPMAGKAIYPGLPGARSPMRRFHHRIQEAAGTGENLLMVGEPGVDMEMVARLIHQSSPRQSRPFVGLNCAALPDDLIDSELCGYERGAFSSATTEHKGLFREAEGGTLFLDEITEMSAETQSNLLRAIQHRAIRPIGATREQPVDVRILASTSREPNVAMAAAGLCEDLHHNLQACILALPPPREKREGIPFLAKHYLTVVNQHHQTLGA